MYAGKSPAIGVLQQIVGLVRSVVHEALRRLGVPESVLPIMVSESKTPEAILVEVYDATDGLVLAIYDELTAMLDGMSAYVGPGARGGNMNMFMSAHSGQSFLYHCLDSDLAHGSDHAAWQHACLPR